MNMIFLDVTYIIVLAAVGVTVLLFVVLFLIFRKREKPKEEVKQIDDNQWLIALGKTENIKAVSVRGSRLSVELLDDKKIDRESLTSLGVKSIITMSNKLILVIEQNAAEIANHISSHLSQNL